MLLLKRIMAQAIDLILGILSIFVTIAFIVPFLGKFIHSDLLKALLAIVIIAGINVLIQYPFMLNGQTVGKGFYRLKIISTDKFRRELPVSVVFQREILCKLLSCYFICLPLFVGKLGGHEEATHTKLVEIG